MPSIKAQINAILRRKDSKLAVIADEIAEEVKEELKEQMYDLWYSCYQPIDYSRTFEVIDAVTADVKRYGRFNYTVRIFFDYSKIKSHQSPNGGWNSHMGFDNQRFAEHLVTSMNKGMSGSPNNPRYGEAAMFLDAVQQYAENLAKKLLRQKLT